MAPKKNPKKPTKFTLKPPKRPEPEQNEHESDVSSVNEDNPAEASGDEDKGSKKDDDNKTGETTTVVTTTTTTVTNTPKVNWTVENDKKLLYYMVVAPEKCKGDENLRRIAQMWRERPTPKAIQVRMSKLREEAKAAAAELDDPRPDNEPTNGEPPAERPHPTVNPDAEVVEGYPFTWSQIPQDTQIVVRDTVDRTTQEMDWARQQQGIVDMHRRNYAAQQAREQVQRERDEAAQQARERAQRERDQAAENLQAIANSGNRDGTTGGGNTGAGGAAAGDADAGSSTGAGNTSTGITVGTQPEPDHDECDAVAEALEAMKNSMGTIGGPPNPSVSAKSSKTQIEEDLRRHMIAAMTGTQDQEDGDMADHETDDEVHEDKGEEEEEEEEEEDGGNGDVE